MKKLTLALALTSLFFLNGNAQSNNAIIVFTEGGERFYLILNGIRQNSTPETNVRATGLNAQQYKAKVIFDQKGIADCDKSIPMMWAAEPVSNTEFTFSIKKDKKGNYKWQFVSQAPISNATSTINSASTPTVTNTVSGQTTNVNQNTQSINTNVNTNTVTTVSSTTTTNSNGGVNAAGANINIGINGTGLTMNMNVNDGMNTSGTTTTTTSSYTTTTTTNGITSTNTGSTSQNNSGNIGNVGISMNVNETNAATNVNSNLSSTSATNTANTNSTYASSSGNCNSPMNSTEFADAKKSISSKPFEDTKKTIAMQIADNNCLSVDQIKGIMGLFSFEDTKLEYAKYCYGRCSDKKNYYKVNDAFTFDASAQELNDFIKGK